MSTNTNNNNKHVDPTEMEEVTAPMDPLIHLLHLRHTIACAHTTAEEKAAAKEKIMAEVTEHNMRPFYRLMCEMFSWPVDEALITSMDAANEKIQAELDRKLKDASENLGDSEIREALLQKCEHYARIGDLDNCLKFNQECAEKTLAPGPKIDLCFQRIRLGIAFGNNNIAAKGIQEAHRLMKDGDWSCRNRLKVYEGLYQVFIRNFEKGSRLLIDALETFTATELLDYRQFVFIAVVSALPTLGRAELKKSVVENPEVLTANLKEINDLVQAVHRCVYKAVFPALDAVCQTMRRVVYLSAHVHYFFREVRVMIFNQFLDSYSSVTLTSMSQSFGIPVTVLDQMLFALISNERLTCKIDRVSGSVITYRGDATNFQYHKIVKNGDLLLNRIQKLSRLVDM